MQNKYIIIILAIICGMGLSSCDDKYDQSELSSKSYIVLYAFPSTNDTLDIIVSVTRPLDGKTKELNVRKLSCMTGTNEDRIIDKKKDEYNGIPVILYRAVGHREVGDRVTISVEADNLMPVTASTVIPDKVAMDTLNITNAQYRDGSYTLIRTGFDNTNPDKYYAVTILKASRTRNYYYDPTDEDWKYTEQWNSENLLIETSAEPLLSADSYMDFLFDSWNEYMYHMYIFNTKWQTESHIDLHLYTQLYYDDRYRYTVQLFALSQEYYRMLRSINDHESNDLGGNGLSFVSSTYTNVKNGFGCVGAYACTERVREPKNNNYIYSY